MKPIPDKLAKAMPDSHAFFVAWVESSNEVKAAILQGRADVAALIRSSHERLDAYLAAVRRELGHHASGLDRLLKLLGGGQRERPNRDACDN